MYICSSLQQDVILQLSPSLQCIVPKSGLSALQQILPKLSFRLRFCKSEIIIVYLYSGVVILLHEK